MVALVLTILFLLIVWSQLTRKDKVKEKSINKINFRNEYYLPLVCEYVEKGKNVSINLKGNSMRPFLESDRDVGWLQRADGYKIGELVLAEIFKGHFVLHRIDDIRVKEKKFKKKCCDKDADVTLRGDGNVRGTESCKLKDVRALCFKVIRNGKEWDLTKSKRWKVFSWYWTHTLFIRRYQLALYKILWRHELPQRWKKK